MPGGRQRPEPGQWQLGLRVAPSQEGSGQDLKVAESREARVKRESGEIQDLGLWMSALPTELGKLGGEGDLEG